MKSIHQVINRTSPSAHKRAKLAVALLALALMWPFPAFSAEAGTANETLLQQRENFIRAWRAANLGQRKVLDQLKPGLQDYLLYPYLQYDDLLQRKASVSDEEMSAFLKAHEDWAFTAGLRRAWLKALGEQARWETLLEYAVEPGDAIAACYLAQARIKTGNTEGLLVEAQDLWTVGKSQPDACDPVFDWLRRHDGITPELAWERIRLAMEAGEPGLARYLSRFLEAEDQIWVKRWREQYGNRYIRLGRAKQWPDQEKSRVITRAGLRRMARNDPDLAWQIYRKLQDHIHWSDDSRNEILYEIALWSAVDGAPETAERMRAVPPAARDDKLLEWWVRFDLAGENWSDLLLTIADMPEELKNDARWRYWEARARLQAGEPGYARDLFMELAMEANYYGFLSADYLDQPYTICPQEPMLDVAEIASFRDQPAVQRALELHRAGIKNWARSEWGGATRTLDKHGLRLSAAIAHQEDWPVMTIFALGKSGDLRWYDWRFPVEYGALVERHARDTNLDPAWVMGLMRSESAMAEDALSSAGARGLMQIMPDTASKLAKRHHIPYSGPQQLMQAEENVRLGTTYLRELLDLFGGNPVLVSGAYNAGPGAVNRWLKTPSTKDPAIWIETLPYFETRDYIPRVLAFSTIYDWRLQLPVRRITSRMPALDSGSMGPDIQASETTEVVCRAADNVTAAKLGS